MSIAGIGHSYINSIGMSSNNSHKSAAVSGSQSKKDTANISEAAKELAALKSGTTAQEEATESASAKLQEQLSGLQ